MKGNCILLSSNPKGQFIEGVMGDTSKPGCCVQVKAATAFSNGRPTFVAAAPGTDGKQVMQAILLEDSNQGFGPQTAYVVGTRAIAYVPIAGEEMNVRLGEVAGTGNTYAIGDRVVNDAEDGIYVPAPGTEQDTPFIVQETLTQVAGGTLGWVQRQ
jgi:hypothetical protein